jgi:NADH:ubiquinone oxidoreductase subunit F (NADH-binding)
VREEYPLAVQFLQKAIDDARELGFLGDNILGSGYSFDIRISRGAGAFVCGESSALMRSVAGNVGEPRSKYIHSTEKGLWDKPTVLNNVETFACVPLIIYHGADWFRGIGVDKNSGTKVFSLVGHVNNTGLVEVPMGATLRDIIFGIGGGISGNRPFKAVQTGGPSGGCLPESKLDCSVDFDTLTREGSMMGSGGMIVMSDYACMVDVARYFLKFLQEESCGKCTPCRDGVHQMYMIVCDICEGKGKMKDLEILETLSEIIKTASLCALGKSAPNPLDSTLKYFREEYIEHIRDGKCRAGVCRDLCDYEINEKCTGCMLCLKVCPVEAITGEKKQLHVIDKEKCIKCGECFKICRDDAVSY